MHKPSSEDRFDWAHGFTAAQEGGHADHPADRGGPTAYGVSLRLLQDMAASDEGRRLMQGLSLPLPPTAEAMRGIGKDTARALLRHLFWDGPRLGDFASPSAAVLYDTGVNCGVARAVHLAQQAFNSLLAAGQVDGQALLVDGKPGPKTRAAFMACTAEQAMLLARQTIALRQAFHERLVAGNPGQAVFLKGWLRRCRALAAYIGEVEHA